MLQIVDRLRRKATGTDAGNIASTAADIPDQLDARLNPGPIRWCAIRPFTKYLFNELVASWCGEKCGTIPAYADCCRERRHRLPFCLGERTNLKHALMG